MDGIHLHTITEFSNIDHLPWECKQTIQHGDVLVKSSPVWRYEGRGLYMSYNHNSKSLRVKGSLQKFYKGNNYSGFTFKEFKESVGTLADVLNCKPVDLAVINNEISTTINHHPIHLMVNELDSHAFQNMVKPGTSKVYGAECNRSERRAKIYDKTLSERMYGSLASFTIPDNLVQVELVLRSKKQYKGNGFNLILPPTLNDLIQPGIYRNSYNMLIDMTKRIQMKGSVDWLYVAKKHNLKPAAIGKILTISDPSASAYLKQIKPQTWKDNKSLYDMVKNDLSEDAANASTEFQKAVAESVARKFDG